MTLSKIINKFSGNIVRGSFFNIWINSSDGFWWRRWLNTARDELFQLNFTLKIYFCLMASRIPNVETNWFIGMWNYRLAEAVFICLWIYERGKWQIARTCLVKREKGPSPWLVMRTHVQNVESGGFHIRIVNSCVCRLLADRLGQSCRFTSCATHVRRNTRTVTIVFTSSCIHEAQLFFWEGSSC
jgi:hypothetical protein